MSEDVESSYTEIVTNLGEDNVFKPEILRIIKEHLEGKKVAVIDVVGILINEDYHTIDGKDEVVNPHAADTIKYLQDREYEIVFWSSDNREDVIRRINTTMGVSDFANKHLVLARENMPELEDHRDILHNILGDEADHIDSTSSLFACKPIPLIFPKKTILFDDNAEIFELVWRENLPDNVVEDYTCIPLDSFTKEEFIKNPRIFSVEEIKQLIN